MSVTAETIPPEIHARVAANTLFDAVRRGDFATAARAQERLRGLGWHLTREPEKPARKPSRASEARP
jgi:hypothetical protein